MIKQKKRSRPRRAIPAKRPSSPFSALEGAVLLGELVRKELEQLQKPRRAMTETQRGTLMRRCSATLKELGELTGQTLEMPESKLVRMPAIRRMFGRVVSALEPWPEALAAVSEALAAIERGEAPGGQAA